MRMLADAVDTLVEGGEVTFRDGNTLSGPAAHVIVIDAVAVAPYLSSAVTVTTFVPL
jgi:hypothetical protein